MKKITSYDDFCMAFDKMEECNLMDARKTNPAIRLSEFRKENPAKYDEFRKRMQKEHAKKHCASFNDKDNTNNENLLNSFRGLPI